MTNADKAKWTFLKGTSTSTTLMARTVRKLKLIPIILILRETNFQMMDEFSEFEIQGLWGLQNCLGGRIIITENLRSGKIFEFPQCGDSNT